MSENENRLVETQIDRTKSENMEPPVQSSTNHHEHLSYKNRLQEFIQRSAIPLPVYKTLNEGAQHAPKFRSTVLVDGLYYTSQETFPQLKAAEQDVARIAFFGLSKKIKDEGCPLIREDTIFCKSILNEYAVKMNLEKPTYTTIRTQGLLPIFVSSSVVNGVTYTGNAGKNKKEAEQLAARAAILSILGESCPGSVMSEIVKSKFRLYAALNRVKNLHTTNNGIMDVGPNAPSSGVPDNMPTNVVSETFSGQLPNIPGHPPLHEYKKPKVEPTCEPVDPPIAFVPSVMQPPFVAGSTSGRKQSRKNKKAKKKVQVDAPKVDFNASNYLKKHARYRAFGSNSSLLSGPMKVTQIFEFVLGSR